MADTFFIAISGCSSTGKTTLANITKNCFPEALLLHEDDFYLHDDEIPINKKYNIPDWDCAESLNIELLMEELSNIRKTGQITTKLIHNNNIDDIRKFLLPEEYLEELTKKYSILFKKYSKHSQFQIVIVEGFMLFHQDRLLNEFDCKLLIRSPYEILKKRRNARPGYQTLDSYWKDPPYYFDEFVYKGYKESHRHLFEEADVEKSLKVEYANVLKDYLNTDEKDIREGLDWVYKEISQSLHNKYPTI
ncbi:hypothetical protein TBLA_0D00390 [Henningerozyma blattae CBS 6284]|uniref:Phosphoribulokinase/uridine kinase domain-containing protein n=1 Tax=Henningerozyma blattae (strain ATCC 34711 / CBS 6284 / DSM 70876 / NBRC 10599 / NRRL Y-10934 / UCD 77-7) TaxID=1071380 RepID=I2H2E7_HENB6|nr:hypothetical protein TBLA_0D00390 [Tetrapisispora blattae CBS 6284]CCH60549.1 hypothetical protein TBLA_0D00390 [Tetrapisispora blattae CBS 6284]